MSRIEGPPNGLLIVISAPSGGGKTTLCEQLLKTNPNTARAITCTTRPPRPGEKDGVDYFFLDLPTFEQKVQNGDFLEHANVFGNRYGTLKGEVLNKVAQGKDVLLSIDVQGAAAIREKAAAEAGLKQALVSVFLAPTGLDVLERRLKKRGTDSEEVIARRLSLAREEIAQAIHFDYVIISQSIEEDLRRMQAIVIAEKLRSTRTILPSP